MEKGKENIFFQRLLPDAESGFLADMMRLSQNA
jgi:hypothetical protein